MKNIVKVKDLPYVRCDVESIKSAFAGFEASTKLATSAKDYLDARKTFLDSYGEYITMSNLAYTRYTLDTRDTFYLGEQQYYDEVSPIAKDCYARYSEIMLNSPFRKELEKELPETLYRTYENTQKAHCSAIIPEEQEENAIVTEYSQLMSQLTTDWRGEKKTISYIRGFLTDSDRNVRKQSAEAIDKCLSSASDKLDEIYDRLVKVRDKMAKKMGYKDYVDMGYYRMNRIGYNRDMVENFRANVLKDIVPIVVKLKDKIAKSLKIDDFKFYDNDIIEGEGNPRPFSDEQGILQSAKEMYNEMSKDTGEFMESMLEAEAFDVTARDGKWGGGYCTEFNKFKQPFILANFNGSADDVDVMTHEFGHAIASHYMFEYGDEEVNVGGMETAETHSMSMEFFAEKYMDKFFKDPERYRYSHIASCLTFIPYGVIVDEYQHVVYSHPEMTPTERNQAYLELEKKYRPYLNYEGLPYLSKGTRWQFQMHIYELPFYYIDYCLAQVVALEFLSESIKDYDDALKRYLDHAKRGGKYPFNKLVELAGLKSPFENGALKEVAKTTEGILEKFN